MLGVAQKHTHISETRCRCMSGWQRCAELGNSNYKRLESRAPVAKVLSHVALYSKTCITSPPLATVCVCKHTLLPTMCRHTYLSCEKRYFWGCLHELPKLLCARRWKGSCDSLVLVGKNVLGNRPSPVHHR